MSPEFRIARALEVQLQTLFSGPIAFENIDFDEEVLEANLRVAVSYTNTRPAIYGSDVELYEGALNVDILTPLNSGAGEGRNLGGTIRQGFRSSVYLTDVEPGQPDLHLRFRESNLGSSYVWGPKFVTPVTATWFTYN